jgi:hypothetical protein
MTNLFSAVSGQFPRALILGTFLPVVVFALLALVLVVPLLPSEVSLLEPLRALDANWRPVALTMVVVLVTGLLYNLNGPLIRLYEGYPWRMTWLGTMRTSRYQRQVAEAELTLTRLIALRRQLKGIPHPPEIATDVQSQLGVLGRLLNVRFPAKDLVLPTKFGNTIRSFEEYSRHQYGMSAIPLWPRLVAVLDKDYSSRIDDAKGAMDFALHSSFLSAVLAACILGLGAATGRPFVSLRAFVAWLITGGAFALLAHILYVAAVGAAEVWGAQVKGAFDLYRWKLLEHLGYQRKPTTRAEERTAWLAISRQKVFGDPIEGEVIPYAVPKPAREAAWLESFLRAFFH